MAGVKGKSGGARPGAGRKRTAGLISVQGIDDPLAFLVAVMGAPDVPGHLRVRAAVAAAQYTHTKRGDGGKKEEREGAATVAASGRFASAQPPKLIVNNG